jgi:two-component system copper resistance phosphate regulon response regulator CusR
VKRILIVEDDSQLSGSIASHLQGEGYSCVCAYDAHMAVKFIHQEDFDLVLLDINLPGMNGLEFCRQLRFHNPQVPVLIITAFGDIDTKMEAFGVGADDYLVKPFHFREMSAKVKVFLKRAEQTPALEEIIDGGELKIDPNQKTVTRRGTEIHLTPKEYNLLEYLFKNRGRIISKEELARNLWDSNYGVTANTIEVYINFLRNKIDKGFEHRYILTKPGFGYYVSVQDR